MYIQVLGNVITLKCKLKIKGMRGVLTPSSQLNNNKFNHRKTLGMLVRRFSIADQIYIGLLFSKT
jgi:hypothetical protein